MSDLGVLAIPEAGGRFRKVTAPLGASCAAGDYLIHFRVSGAQVLCGKSFRGAAEDRQGPVCVECLRRTGIYVPEVGQR